LGIDTNIKGSPPGERGYAREHVFLQPLGPLETLVGRVE